MPFICANVRSDSSEPLFQPHVIRQVGDLKVGIFAVVADEAYGFPVQEWRKGLKVEPPVEAASARSTTWLPPAANSSSPSRTSR